MFVDASTGIIQLVVPVVLTGSACHIIDIIGIIDAFRAVIRAIITGVIDSVIEGSTMASGFDLAIVRASGEPTIICACKAGDVVI